MAYITLANANRIIFNSNVQRINLSGEIYKIPIHFFNRYEKNALLAIQELLKDPKKYFSEIFTPFNPIDTFQFVYEGKNPSFHESVDCSRLTSKYENKDKKKLKNLGFGLILLNIYCKSPTFS